LKVEKNFMRRKLTCLLIVSLLVALLTPAVSAQDFGVVFNAIDQIKSGDTSQISITVADQSFSVTVNDRGATPKLLGTFPLREWPTFIDEAVNHGLRKYSRYRYGESDEIELTFVNAQNTKLSTGKAELNVPSNFFDYMTVFKEFPAQQGKNGFAILIYDPHLSVPGRFQLIPALNELVRSNPSVKFKLLNEGEYEKEDRNIPFNGLDTELKNIPDGPAGSDLSPALVYVLLERYIIDCAMAYRLIYNKDMPSRAIDDNPALADEDRVREGQNALDGSFEWIVLQINDKAEDFLSDAKNGTVEQRAAASELVKAIHDYDSVQERLYSTPERPTRAIVSDYDKASALLKTVVELAEKFQHLEPGIQLGNEISLVKGKVPFQARRAFANNYATRESVMATEIIAESNFTSAYTPIAFLGYSHLYAITADLSSKGIGYAVFRPRLTGVRDYGDAHKFNRFVSPATRADYLKEATKWNKGPVGLTAAQIASLIRPFIREGAAKFQSERLAERAAFAKQANLTVDYDNVLRSIAANGVLSQATIQIEAPPNVQPPNAASSNVPPNAVAYFEAGSSGTKSRLVILEPRGEGWRGASGQARYETLRTIPLEYSPAKYSTDMQYFKLPSGQRAGTVSDPLTRRTYIISGRPAAMSDILTIRPNSKQGGSSTRIRVLISELERKQERKSTTNGE
jgi:hypothetical protein